MGYRYEERFRDLQAGDISGVIQIYGRRQPDTIVAAAPPLATHARRMSPARLYARRWGSRAFTAPAP